MPTKKGRGPTSADGQPLRLLEEDYSEIKIVPARDRDWWSRLGRGAKARFAERYRQKWTDEETERLVRADPDRDDYFELGAAMGRSPGALRARRSQMIHLLREEYQYVGKAEAYLADPKAYHKWADIAQVYRILRELGLLELPVHEQFAYARHLRQPSSGWRGDHSFAAERGQPY
jgi:hypothetical protein